MTNEYYPIARTKERVAMADDKIRWWKEYQLVRNKYDQWYVQYRYIGRYTDQYLDKIFVWEKGGLLPFTHVDSAWRQWTDLFLTGPEAIDDVIGDSDLFEADSLHEWHAEAVERLRIARERSERLHEAEEKAKRAHEQFEQWKRDRQREFNKRHGDKTGEAYEKAKTRTIKRLKDEHNSMKEKALRAAEEYRQVLDEQGLLAKQD